MWMMIDHARCYYNGVSQVSPQAGAFIENSGNCQGLTSVGLMNDLFSLNTCVYTYWDRTPSDPNASIINSFKETADINANIKDDWYSAIARDTIFRKSSRVFGAFWVLLERKDGTILISEDFSQVYLVLGLAQSFGDVSYC